MYNCKQCGIEAEAKRSTKQFCSTKCRVLFHYLGGLTSNASVVTENDNCLDFEEALEILNYYYFNERELLARMSVLEFFNVLYQKTKREVVFSAENGFSIAEIALGRV